MTAFRPQSTLFCSCMRRCFPSSTRSAIAPIFLRLTQPYPERKLTRSPRGVASSSFVLLLAFAVVGSHVLEFFGLTLPIVRIAGGLVVAALGWRLLHASEESEDQRSAADKHARRRNRRVLSIDHAADGRAGVDLGRHRPRQPTSSGSDELLTQLAALAVRRGGRHRRDRCHDLPLLPISPGRSWWARQERHQRPDATVGLHPVLHRRPGRLDRLFEPCPLPPAKLSEPTAHRMTSLDGRCFAWQNKHVIRYRAGHRSTRRKPYWFQ